MELEQQFEQIYEQFRAGRDLIRSIERIESGIPRWRIHVFEKGTAPTGGDRELLFAEAQEKDECLKKAIKILDMRLRCENA